MKGLGVVLRTLAVAACIHSTASAAAPAQATQPSVTLQSLLAEMVDRNALARYPLPAYTTQQASSYDRDSVAPDRPGWFANRDASQYVRDEVNQGRHEHVRMDVDGPGTITRFWITTQTKDPASVIRVYLDEGSEPAVTFANYDLGANDLQLSAPFWSAHTSKNGSTLYLPIPFSRHCKITVQDGTGVRFYQINYRTYSPDTRVETFSRAGLDAARGLLAKVGRELLEPGSGRTERRASLRGVVQPGDERQMPLAAGPAALTELRLAIHAPDKGDQARVLRSTVLKLEFDGEQTAWVPVGDFSGAGVGGKPLRSLYRDVLEDGTVVVRWVMPYRKSAQLSLLNLGGRRIGYDVRLAYGPWVWDERSMHFHADWRSEELSYPPARDWNFDTIQGQGVLVADELAVFNPVRSWYGEGDEKIWTDNESFPADFGTGTEDYYNASYAPIVPYQTPWANAPRVDDTQTSAGHNTFTRTRVLDAIPFRESLKFDFELIAWGRSRPTYAATTYWYGRPGAASTIEPMPQEARRPPAILLPHVVYHRDGAIEFEKMTVLGAHNMALSVRPVVTAPDLYWSEDTVANLHSETNTPATDGGGEAGASMEFSFPAPDARARYIDLYALKGRFFGQFRVSVNGKPPSLEVDSYAPEELNSGPLRLGRFEPENGRYRIKVEIVGANDHTYRLGKGITIGLDCVVLSEAVSGSLTQ